MIGMVQGTDILAIGASVAVVTRALLQVVVVVWSLRADDKGRKHARAVLRLLKSDKNADDRSGPPYDKTGTPPPKARTRTGEWPLRRSCVVWQPA